jgi:hypothetical protein
MKAVFLSVLSMGLLITVPSPCHCTVSCGKFDVIMKVENQAVVMYIESDLPDDTRIMIGIKRRYKERNNESDYALDYYSAIDERLRDWRTPHSIVIGNDAWRQTLQEKIDEYAALDMWEGLQSISDSLIMEVSVPPYRQPNPAFGENNQELTGQMVLVKKTIRGEVRSIEWKTSVSWPLDGPPPEATRVSVEDLRNGGKYIVETIQGDIPLMPEPNPKDVFAALKKACKLQGVFTMEIRDTQDVDTITWFRIQAYYPSGEALASGWISSLALTGNKLSKAM